MLPKGTTTQKSLEAIDQIASFYRQASQPKVIVDELGLVELVFAPAKTQARQSRL